MNAAVDRLVQAKARPLLIENAVRTALRDAVAWRIGGGSAPTPDAFANAAIAAARQALDENSSISSNVSQTLAIVLRVATHFTTSALGRRLMTVPAAQFVRLPPVAKSADVIVRDQRGRLHAIILSAQRSPFEAGRTATVAARITPLPVGDRLTPLSVHVYSLATGRRHTFVCELTPTCATLRERVA